MVYKGKRRWGFGLINMIFAIFLFFPLYELRAAQKIHPSFDYRAEPSKDDWRFIIRLSPKEQEKIWNSFALEGVRLKDWSWGWRLGWIRVCTKSRAAFCHNVLEDALKDRALVVRAEGVTALGRLYASTENKVMLKRVAEVGSDQRNQRHKKPLFIQKRVIFALKSIGGEEAQKLAQKVAREDPMLKDYIKKLFR